MKYEFTQPIVPTYALTYSYTDGHCWLYLDKVLFWRIEGTTVIGIVADTTPELIPVIHRDSLVGYFVEPNMKELDILVRKKYLELKNKFKSIEVYINGVRGFYENE